MVRRGSNSVYDQPTLFTAESAWEEDTFILTDIVPESPWPDHPNRYMRKPFVMWDGEGYTDEQGFHHYWLLANSCGDKIIAPEGRSLDRRSIAQLFMRTLSKVPDAINAGFALGYDFTCMMRSNAMTADSFNTFYDKSYFIADGFVWRAMMGKILTVFPDGMVKHKFTLQDTWGFFQKSFVKALDEYFGTEWLYRDEIVEMKSQRGHFDRKHDKEVMGYNDKELILGVILLDELRRRLYDAGMPIQKWYGPGALASGLLDQHKIKDTLVNLYEDEPQVAEAARYAYSGGRFELLRPGHSNGPVYQYDINSAYPSAIAKLPNLATGKWTHLQNPKWDDINGFTVVRISVDYSVSTDSEFLESLPFPFWRRSKSGAISYPSNSVKGWYWSPEVFAAREYLRSVPNGINSSIVLEEAWRFDSDGSRPFEWVAQLYRNRQKLKAMGNGAHVGIKLGLNSLYGKLAQQVGWVEDGKFPPFHNLALAGWVTAHCRAQLMRAMALNPRAMIAFETDAVFSTEPLNLPVGPDMGQWDFTQYDDMYYLASGFRFGIKDGEVKKPATRGIPAKDIDLDRILNIVHDSDHALIIEQTNFISMRWAIAMGREHDSGQWIDSEKHLQFMCENLKGKRIHDPMCRYCWVTPSGIREYDWDWPHYTIPNPSGSGEMNYPHKVAWVNEIAIDQTEREIEGGFMYDEL